MNSVTSKPTLTTGSQAMVAAQLRAYRDPPVALTDLKPCRCCGETEHLSVDPAASEMQFLFDENGAVIRDVKGEPVDFTDDTIHCRVCGVMAPAFFWNAEPDMAATARLATLAAREEYDDNAVWIGARQ